jgi:hypothetical protein
VLVHVGEVAGVKGVPVVHSPRRPGKATER